MSIRSEALAWYQKKYGQLDKPIYTSKQYRPEESWTKDFVWFLQIPISIIDENKNRSINLLFQKKPGSSDFYHLKVPGYYLIQNEHHFDQIKGKLALYFSPKAETLFKEIRGTKGLDFKKFLIN